MYDAAGWRSSVTPPGGLTATIYGDGFSANPSQNTVTFNWVQASVSHRRRSY